MTQSQWGDAIDPAAFLHGAFDHNIATVRASDASPNGDYVGRHRLADSFHIRYECGYFRVNV